MGELIAGGLVTVLGIFTFFYTLSNPKLTFTPVMSDGAPGAGFFPIILSVLLFVLGLTLVFANIRNVKRNLFIKQSEQQSKTIEKSNLWTSIILLLAIVIFLFLWKITSLFYIWMFILLIAISKIYKRSWLQTIIIALVITAFLYLMFTVGFSIQFRV